MSDFITVLLAAGTLVFVAYPLMLQRSRKVAVSREDDKFADLYSQRNITYSMIKELEFDHSSGILTDEDYKELDSRYKNKAVAILKDIDDRQGSGSLEDEIEQEVARHRKGNQAERAASGESLDDELEREVRSLRNRTSQQQPSRAEPERNAPRSSQRRQQQPHPAAFCPRCGVKAQAGDHFCRDCGTKLG